MDNIKKEIQNIKNNVNEIKFGVDKDKDLKTQRDMESIQKILNSLNNEYNETNKNNIVELFSKFKFNDIPLSQKIKNKYQTFQNVIDDIFHDQQIGIAQMIYGQEAYRFLNYSNYESIYNYIPQLAEGLELYCDHIMSPDDFTKTFFNIKYNGKNYNEDKIIKINIDKLNKKYKIKKEARNILKKTLLYGDLFVLTLNINKEISKYLELSKEDTTKYYRSGFNLKEDEKKSIIDAFRDELKLNKEGTSDNKKEQENTELQNRVNSFEEKIAATMKNNVEFNPNSYSYLRKEIEKQKEEKDVDQENTLEDVKGSIFKVVLPKNVIKLVSMDNEEFGYILIETPELVPNESTTQTFSNTLMPTSQMGGSFGSMSPRNQQQFSSNPLVGNYAYGNLDQTKYGIITKIFSRHISEQINFKFIKDNPEFSNLIYTLLKQDYILKKKIVVTYLRPDEVTHFYVNKNIEYGESLYKKILFTAKIYLAVLTSTFLTKLIRSQSKRAYYIETSLDEDIEQTVQSFVRDIKTKEFKFSDFESVDTVLNSIGSFNDFYIPTVNGEKPVEIETVEGLDANMEDEFLEYLRKTMISGLGIPPAFLGYEEVEFMRTLAMQNGRFVRTIIGYQQNLGETFTELYKKLYINEFLSHKSTDYLNLLYKNKTDEEIKKETDELEQKSERDSININKLEILFPPPASLNMTNLTEQINNSQTLIDFIKKILVGETIEDADYAFEVTKGITKKIVSSIEWDEYENLIDSITKEYAIKKISKLEDKGGEEAGALGGGDAGGLGGGGGDAGADAGGGDAGAGMEDPNAATGEGEEMGGDAGAGGAVNPEKDDDGIPTF